jgi:hypothetical protein
VVGLLLFIAAGGWSSDGQQLDVQTLALLSAGLGYCAARIWGTDRISAIEVGFVVSVAGSIYASLTRDASQPVLGVLAVAVLFALLAYALRRWLIPVLRQLAQLPHDAPVPAPPAPATRDDVAALVCASEQRVRHAQGESRQPDLKQQVELAGARRKAASGPRETAHLLRGSRSNSDQCQALSLCMGV